MAPVRAHKPISDYFAQSFNYRAWVTASLFIQGIAICSLLSLWWGLDSYNSKIA
jgi:hypothetical protein